MRQIIALSHDLWPWSGGMISWVIAIIGTGELMALIDMMVFGLRTRERTGFWWVFSIGLGIVYGIVLSILSIVGEVVWIRM